MSQSPIPMAPLTGPTVDGIIAALVAFRERHDVNFIMELKAALASDWQIQSREEPPYWFTLTDCGNNFQFKWIDSVGFSIYWFGVELNADSIQSDLQRIWDAIKAV